MDIITLDEECCIECGCYLGLLRSTLCWECEQDIRYQEQQEMEESCFWDDEDEQDWQTFLAIEPTMSTTNRLLASEDPGPSLSPLSLPRNEKPRRTEPPAVSEEKP